MKKRAMAIAAAFALTMSMGMGVAAKDDLVIAEMMDCGTLAPTGPTVEMRSDITYQVYEGLFRYGYSVDRNGSPQYTPLGSVPCLQW